MLPQHRRPGQNVVEMPALLGIARGRFEELRYVLPERFRESPGSEAERPASESVFMETPEMRIEMPQNLRFATHIGYSQRVACKRLQQH